MISCIFISFAFMMYNTCSKFLEVFVMEYLSALDVALKWGISKRRVQILCIENRITGVKKVGNMWLIPEDADKPDDKRIKLKKDK